MRQHKEILIQNSLEKSDQALKSAKDNIEIGNLETSQNRIYYAIFYAVLALGYCEGFVTSKHTELFGWFNSKMVYEKGIFSTDLQKIYKAAQEARMKSDYTFNYKPDEENLINLFEDAKVFIDEIKKYIENKGFES